MSTKQTYFNKIKLTDEKDKTFWLWFQEVKNDKAKYKPDLCRKEGKVLNMGIDDVHCHMESSRRKRLLAIATNYLIYRKCFC